MLLATLITNFANTKNEIFKEDQSNDPDGYRYKYLCLKNELTKHKINIATPDINKISKSRINVYVDIPKKIIINSKAISVLIIAENPTIYKKNWIKSYHDLFDLIFTWNDKYVDNIKYYKFQFTYKFPQEKFKIPFNKKKFLTLISENKKINHENELYSERLRAIRWLEKNIPDEFDLYGRSWNKLVSANKFINFIYSKLIHPISFFNIKTKSYKGDIFDKVKTLLLYKFSICYENASNYSGYITEKIFHCFFSNVVPIYLGANNIDNYIPSNCYIDKNKYRSYSDLIFFLKSINEKQYEEYLKNINNFLNSKKAEQFKSELYSKFIVKKILDLSDIKK